jgi:ferredoxin
MPMAAYRIVLDRSLCSGFASCADSAPGVFRLDESGVAETLVGTSDEPSVLEAASSCPMGAISIFDQGTGGQIA